MANLSDRIFYLPPENDVQAKPRNRLSYSNSDCFYKQVLMEPSHFKKSNNIIVITSK